jgi:preprotein translocase subunit Sec61beta
VRPNSTRSAGAGGSSSTMLRLYTDESPGLKVDPVVVLVLSLVFIFSVVALHSELFFCFICAVLMGVAFVVVLAVGGGHGLTVGITQSLPRSLASSRARSFEARQPSWGETLHGAYIRRLQGVMVCPSCRRSG